MYKFKEANLFVFSDCIGIALPIKNDAKITFKFICLTKWWDQRTNTMMMFDETGLSAYNNADNVSSTPPCSSSTSTSTNTSSTSASIAEYLALPELDDTTFGPQIVLDEYGSASDSEDLSFSSVDALSFGSSHRNHSPRGEQSFGLSLQQVGTNGHHSPAEVSKDLPSPNSSGPSSSSSTLSAGSSKSKRRSSRSSRSRSRSRSSTIIDPTTQRLFLFSCSHKKKKVGTDKQDGCDLLQLILQSLQRSLRSRWPPRRLVSSVIR